jgi:hypothetical protein
LLASVPTVAEAQAAGVDPIFAAIESHRSALAAAAAADNICDAEEIKAVKARPTPLRHRYGALVAYIADDIENCELVEWNLVALRTAAIALAKMGES